MAIPFQDAASKSDTPGGTRAATPEGEKRNSTRPVPSWCSIGGAGGRRKGYERERGENGKRDPVRHGRGPD